MKTQWCADVRQLRRLFAAVHKKERKDRKRQRKKERKKTGKNRPTSVSDVLRYKSFAPSVM